MSVPRLRQATAADRPFLDELFAVHRRGEFAALQLPESQLASLVAMQAQAQRSGYARDFPDAVDRIVLSPDDADDTPIGRLLVARRHDGFRLVDIALMPARQGEGIGTALISGLIEEADRAGLPIRLHVRPANRAFRLYSRLGFRLVGAGVDLEMEYGSPCAPGAIAEIPERQDEDEPGAGWKRQIGCSFEVDAEPAGKLPPLVLTSVEFRSGRSSRGFSLLFQAPLPRFYPQGTYAIRRTAPGELAGSAAWEHLFLVPVGPKGDAMEYEAIFNLL